MSKLASGAVPVLVGESTATLPSKTFSCQSGNRSGTCDSGKAVQARFCPPDTIEWFISAAIVDA
jgi:hypothetical protein